MRKQDYIAIAICLGLIISIMLLFPWYNVYRLKMKGKAEAAYEASRNSQPAINIDSSGSLQLYINRDSVPPWKPVPRSGDVLKLKGDGTAEWVPSEGLYFEAN